MILRSTQCFETPFKLNGFEEPLSAGTYDIDTDEEVVEGNRRNVRTAALHRTKGMAQISTANPQELQAQVAVDEKLGKENRFRRAAEEDRTFFSDTRAERDLGSVGAAEVAQFVIHAETLRIVQAMQDEELISIVQRMTGGIPRLEIEQAALVELELRGSPNTRPERGS